MDQILCYGSDVDSCEEIPSEALVLVPDSPPPQSSQAIFSQQESEPSSQASRVLRSNTLLEDRKCLPMWYTRWVEREGQSEFYYIDRLPVPSSEDLARLNVRPKKVKPWEARDTDEVGQRLIQRGFPLVGRGSGTLCFLLNDHYVMKVPCNVNDGVLAEQFYEERHRDLVLHSRWPSCWPRTRYVVLFIDDGRAVPYYAYVQQRLIGPFTKEGFHADMIPGNDIYSIWHAQNMRELLDNNTDVMQFAYTVPMSFTIHHPGGVIEHTDERSWLQAVDYH